MKSRIHALIEREFGADDAVPKKARPDLVASILARLATEHHMVYCAAGAEMLARQFPGTLRVHVVAPDSVRIGNLMLDRRLDRPPPANCCASWMPPSARNTKACSAGPSPCRIGSI